jgi:UDP-glucose 4-epimerase
MKNIPLTSRILVIGGSGFVGSHLVDLLVTDGFKNIVVFDNFVRGKKENLKESLTLGKIKIVNGDIRDDTKLKKVMKGVDYVFHLAALWLLECYENPRECFEVNFKGTLNVLEAARLAKVKKLIFSSSASVYGDMLAAPINESHPLNNRTMYGASKIAGEQMCRAYFDMYKLPWLGLRYFNIYGPRQDYEGAYVSVIMKALDRIEKGLSPIIFGDGTQTYDFIFVEDVACANLLALKSSLVDDCFNIATGQQTSINELVDLLIRLSGSHLKPIHQKVGKTFVSKRVADITYAKEKLGFVAKTSLGEGLTELIKWRKIAKNKL